MSAGARRLHADKTLGSDRPVAKSATSRNTNANTNDGPRIAQHRDASCLWCCLFAEGFNELQRIAHARPNSLSRPAGCSARRRLWFADGRVLVTGGGFPAAAFTEIYDPATEQWAIAEDLQVARRGHTATLLANGRVLIAGGLVCCTDNREAFSAAAEIYDPTTGRFQLTDSLRQGRGFHRATLLADGRVLLSGGFGGPDLGAWHSPLRRSSIRLSKSSPRSACSRSRARATRPSC